MISLNFRTISTCFHLSLLYSDYPCSHVTLVFSAVPPSIQQFDDVVTVSGGRPSLTCVVRSAPRPVVTFLDRLGAIIVMSSNFQVATTGPDATFAYTSTLTFLRSTTVDDDALYTCTATNGFVTTRDTALLTVNGTLTGNVPFVTCCCGNDLLAMCTEKY